MHKNRFSIATCIVLWTLRHARPGFPPSPSPFLSLFLFLARDALLQAYENGTISVTLSAPFRCISRPNYMPAMQNSLFSPAIARRPALTSRMFCPVNYNGDFVNWVRHVRKRVIAAIPLIPETGFDLRPLTCFFQPLSWRDKILFTIHAIDYRRANVE